MDRRRQTGSVTQMRFALAFAICLIAATTWASPNETGSNTSEVTIDELITRLDSDSFDKRKQATLDLIDLGATATVPVVKAIKTGSREVVMRGIHVLSQQARSDSPDTEQAARAALQRVLQFDDRSAVINASSALRAVDMWRQSNAIAELRRLGAETNESVLINGAFMANHPHRNRELFITDGWRGQPEDLKHLRWVKDVEQLYVSGKHIGDAHMAYIATAPSLSSLILDRTSVTDEGLAHLKTMTQLSEVHIQYATLSDAGVEHLTQIENLFKVGLKGTKISNTGEQQLIARVGSNLELHRGALLGVSASPIQPAGIGCPVSSVTPGSAAEKCGIRSQDVIIAIGKEKIDSFTTLKQVMSKKSGGEKVDIKFRRGNETMTANATLGEWPIFNQSRIQRPNPRQPTPQQRPIRQVPSR